MAGGDLGAYGRKRRFGRTPEPAPLREAPARTAAERRFVVHKHHARRLHYDLRLEFDGALASWAVPKGPSYDPAVKRLAVQTEDHPLEYASFEGRIPEGEYGGGDSLVWDRGSWSAVPPEEADRQRERGHLLVELHGEKLHGRWHLVRTGRGDGGRSWLLFKAKDEAADPAFDVVAERPESVLTGRRLTRGPERRAVLRASHPAPRRLLERVWPPMLATLVERLPGDASRWQYELKLDGFRALAGLSGGRVALWSRNGLDLAERFPGIARALEGVVVGEAVVDGEIAAIGRDGAPRFELLQRGEAPPVFFAFDLLWLDGEDLRRRPLRERRELLESLLANAPEGVRLCEIVGAPAERALEIARDEGQEGIVAKDRASPYVGTRSTAWQKRKLVRSQEAVVVGMTPSASGRAEIGALLVAVAEEGGFRYAGKVGTGFSEQERRALWEGLLPAVVDSPTARDAPRLRGARWLLPAAVCEVRFAEWTRDGRMRHPSFLGLRPDEAPEECVRERPAAGEAR